MIHFRQNVKSYNGKTSEDTDGSAARPFHKYNPTWQSIYMNHTGDDNMALS